MSDDGTLASAPSAGKKAPKSASQAYEASATPMSATAKPMQSGTDQLAEFIEQQPFTAAMVALIVGYFIGKIT